MRRNLAPGLTAPRSIDLPKRDATSALKRRAENVLPACIAATGPVRGLRALLRDSSDKPVAIVRMVVVGHALPRVVMLHGGAYLLHPDSSNDAPVYQFELPYRAGDSFTELLAELPS